MTATSGPEPRQGSHLPDEAAATTPGTPGGIDEKLREEGAIRQVNESLAADYSDKHPTEEIEQVVTEAREHYSGASVRDFVPILVEREAREELTEPETPSSTDRRPQDVDNEAGSQ